ncbi:unnamed protein product, partial [Didymodactylos carnosus]
MIELLVLLLLLIATSNIQCPHFNGGTIFWKPVNNTDLTAPIQVSITQNYVWVSPDVSCPSVGALVNLSSKAGSPPTSLSCTANCVTSGGYVAPLINPYCTSVSAPLGLIYSQRTDIVNLDANDSFTVAFVSNGSYRSLYGNNTATNWA